MLLNFDDTNNQNRYKLMSGTITPRPIAWISTVENGVVNVAPFSYFTALSSNPATVVVSIGKKEDGTPKDTIANILSTKKATINFVNEENLENMKLSSTSLPKNISETQNYNIPTTKILDDFPPIISSVEAAFFCTFLQTIQIGGNTTPLILEIKQAYYKDGICDDRYHINVDNIGRVAKNFATMQKI